MALTKVSYSMIDGASVNVLDFGATGNGTTNDTAAIQAAIDSRTSGGTVYFPRGTYSVTGIRIDGTSANLTNITLQGEGVASLLQIAASNTSNVIKSLSGSGFRIAELKIQGGLGRGVTPLRAPTKGFWTPSTAYVIGNTVEVSSTNTQTSTVAASNLVYRCTLGYTSSATFAADLATYWILSTDPNFNTVDISYGTRNGIYLSGATNSIIEDCTIIDCAYAGINIGTGPVQTGNTTPASAYVRVESNYIDNCDNGIAGGEQSYVNYVGNNVKSCVNFGIVIDDPDSFSCNVTSNTVTGCGSHGIYFYGPDFCTITGNTVNFCVNVGILVIQAAVSSPITGNAVNNCQQGIRLYNNSQATVTGNACRANSQYGISVELMSQVSVVANECNSNTLDGINLLTVSGFSISSNSCSANIGSGIRLDSCSDGSIVGGSLLNNNNGAVPTATGAGVYLGDTTNVAISGMRAFDARGGGSKTQKYGVYSAGTSNAVTLSGNNLTANATAEFLLVGATNRVTPAFADYVNASTPANFTADKILAFLDSDGTTVYMPARLSVW
jgi:parallel beta-helix repeat protein